MRADALSTARLLVRQSTVGVVSTLSKNLQGYPFGSVTPFISDSDGTLFMYISDIAQHARNLYQDSRMSLVVFDQSKSSGDQNEQARVTLVGDAKIVEPDQHQTILDRYLLRFPEANAYTQAHDFNMWQVDIKRVRFIGGFGKIFWLEKDEWQSAESPWDKVAEDRMINHMNEDHQDAMMLIWLQHFGASKTEITMSGIVTDGCYLCSDQQSAFVPFVNVCQTAGDVRKELVALTNAARAVA
jgi:hypothetical protein